MCGSWIFWTESMGIISSPISWQRRILFSRIGLTKWYKLACGICGFMINGRYKEALMDGMRLSGFLGECEYEVVTANFRSWINSRLVFLMCTCSAITWVDVELYCSFGECFSFYCSLRAKGSHIGGYLSGLVVNILGSRKTGGKHPSAQCTFERTLLQIKKASQQYEVW